MKIVVFGSMPGLLPPHSSCTMIAAADGASCVADRYLKIQKNSLPAVPRRGPVTGVIHRENDVHGSGVNQIDSSFVSAQPHYSYLK
jgi:hypothetical protein